jgi:hypothetical protein
MSDMAGKLGTEVYDETEQYDKSHGKTTCDDESKPSGLSEASNKPADEPVPFKITTSK